MSQKTGYDTHMPLARRILIAALLVAGSRANGQSIRKLVTEYPELGGMPVCEIRSGWSMNRGASLYGAPLIYGPDGRLRFPLSVQLPGAATFLVEGFAPDDDGSLVAAALGFESGHLIKSALVFFDANGIQTSFIDTGSFRPGRVVIAPDHSIWLTGAEPRPSAHYNILRKYSRTGTLIASFIDGATFPAGLDPGHPGAGTGLFVTKNRIAVMAYSGMVGTHRELLELDLEGNLPGRMRFDEPTYEFYAFTDGAAFYAARMRPTPTILQLDPIAGTTREITSPAASPWMLYGADGPDLLYFIRTLDDHLKLAWFAPPAN